MERRAPKGAQFRRAAQPVFPGSFLRPQPQHDGGRRVARGGGRTRRQARSLGRRVAGRSGAQCVGCQRKPGSFSGGQRQRIVLARALALSPEFLVLDESVAALDLRIQAEILDLLKDLCERRGLTFLFISHDLNVVGAVCDRIAVMREGEIVEEGPATQLLSSPQHPYTQRLLNSRPGSTKRVGVA